MPVSRFLSLLGIAGLLSLGAWIVVVQFIDPEQTGGIGIGLFYATLGCWLFTLLTFSGLLGRVLLKRLHKQTVIAFHLMLPTLRQALWCTLIVLISLVLASNELFSWLTASLLIVFFTLLEGFLYSLQTRNPSIPDPKPNEPTSATN
jgi:hypothetical protein